MTESTQGDLPASNAQSVGDNAGPTTRPSTKASTEAKLDESTEYCDPLADVHLISSDQTVFRVQSYYLKAHSVVFRSMFDDCSTFAGVKEIPLVGDDIECKRTVNDFLDLAYQAQALDLTNWGNNDRLFNLVKFVLKYDCPVLLELIRSRLRSYLGPGRSAIGIFCAGSIMDDAETCRLAIPYAGVQTWSGDETGTLPFTDECVSGATCLDITGWSTYWWDLVPTPYIHALSRAYRKRGSGTTAELEAVAKEFWRQMKKTDYVEQ